MVVPLWNGWLVAWASRGLRAGRVLLEVCDFAHCHELARLILAPSGAGFTFP